MLEIPLWLDVFFGFFSPSQWDAIRNWLATSGALVALFVATSTYRRNVRIKREEQARLVYSKLAGLYFHEQGSFFESLPDGAVTGLSVIEERLIWDPTAELGSERLSQALAPLIQATVLVHNGSKELIGPVRIQILKDTTNEVLDELSLGVASVDPDGNLVANFIWVNSIYPGEPSLGTAILFRDASGQWWRRHRSEPIERVHYDPESMGPNRESRVAIRRRQEEIGIPVEQRIAEPLVSTNVRWHRFWRQIRGKNPLP